MKSFLSKGYYVASLVIDSFFDFIFFAGLFLLEEDLFFVFLLLIGSLLCTSLNIFWLLRQIKKERNTVGKCFLGKGIVFSFVLATIFLTKDFRNGVCASIFCILGILFVISLEFIRKQT
ncbi:MAG: hypothetical protein Q4C49_08875 [Bacillota bacterium]|nr:hypothetical protein [Bacillota bacterium]